MIGCYIVEYEQNGKERAEYGTQLLKKLAKQLDTKGLEHNQLNLCRMFYLRYPQIFSTVSRKLEGISKDLSYYTFEEMTEGDNPPVGILLCTEKGPKMVQYVLNGMDENLFVSSYMLQLPEKEQLENFLLKEIKDMGL